MSQMTYANSAFPSHSGYMFKCFVIKIRFSFNSQNVSAVNCKIQFNRVAETACNTQLILLLLSNNLFLRKEGNINGGDFPTLADAYIARG